MPAFNAVLLPSSVPELREVVLADGRRGLSQDASYLIFIVEDLVRYSALNLAIEPHSHFYNAANRLPQVYRDRIVRVDRHSVSAEKTRAVLMPVFEELGVPFSLAAFTNPPGSDPDVIQALASVAFSLPRFLVGVDSRVELELSPRRMLTDVQRLSRAVQTPASRANLAILEGIFRTYRPYDVASLTFRSDARPQLAERFQQFVEDETYREMSRDAGLLGLPAKMTHAAIRLRRRTHELVKKPQFKGAVDVTTTTISAATQIPLPKTDTAEQLLSDASYLPPLISLAASTRRAAEAWRSAEPAFDPPVVPPGWLKAQPLEIAPPDEMVDHEG